MDVCRARVRGLRVIETGEWWRMQGKGKEGSLFLRYSKTLYFPW